MSAANASSMKSEATLDVVVIACGEPKKGMGWYHAHQLVQGCVPGARLTDVVEPFFLGAGKDCPAAAVFRYWQDTLGDVAFHATVTDMPPSASQKVAIIAGRTCDNPKYFKQAIDQGCTHIYLEKPGAPSVRELEEMKKYATEKGVPVCMGFNKNVAKYVTNLVEFDRSHTDGSVVLKHGNAYQVSDLPEVFSRNREGLLRNMLIHELVLLVSHFGVTVDSIQDVVPDHDYTEMKTIDELTDFQRLGFTIKTTAGKSFSVKGDRCAPANISEGVVEKEGSEVFRSVCPDEELEREIVEMEKLEPGLQSYFYAQSRDYVVLKEAVCQHILSQKAGTPEGIATLDAGIEALKIADYLTPILAGASGTR